MNPRAVVLLLGLAGCAVLEPGGGALDAIVADAVLAARAPAAEQTAALARAQAAFPGSPADRLRLATLFAALPAPLRDDARAAEILRPIADAGAPGIGQFAALLAAQIAERQRLVQEIERAGRERDRAEKERERSDRERERLDKERDKREEALKQQLDALRAIERSIIEREEKLRRRQR